ncbi:hypothetical protein B0T21DRAFT_383760 [Apiosordaria backusii]|uniref:AB hydrolase-1 domain-containing protein n=1 Tax=Apiosordaria backusii TaxID=314023 RepID=A0AA40EHJ7_9PEZI|nr:hypothetical protein B0T21DRAFT_383760 [Apiosordaria backusii]
MRANLPLAAGSLLSAATAFGTDFDVSEFVSTVASHTPATVGSILSPFAVNVTETYTISATFCRPGHEKPDPKKENTVLIATHGLNFDRTYWDPQLDKETYSFVDWALSQNYSIFYYDRLGTGESEQVSGYVAQLSNQVAILTELTNFGSAISSEVVRKNKKLVDGVILTGFSYNSTHLNGAEFLEAVGGCLTPVDLFASVTTFFHDGYYDTEVARYADDHKAPFAVMELLTGHRGTDALLFSQILSGKYDFPFCMSDCDGVLGNPGASIFSKAKAFKAITLPGRARHQLPHDDYQVI